MRGTRAVLAALVGAAVVVAVFTSSLVLGANHSGNQDLASSHGPKPDASREGPRGSREGTQATRRRTRRRGCPRRFTSRRVCLRGPKGVRGGRKVRFVATNLGRRRRVDLRLRPFSARRRSCKRACDGIVLRGFRVRHGVARLRFRWPTSYGRCVKRCRRHVTAAFSFARWRRRQRVVVELLTSRRNPRRSRRIARTTVRIRSRGRQPRSFRPLTPPPKTLGPQPRGSIR